VRRETLLLAALLIFLSGCAQESHLGLKSVDECESNISTGSNALKIQCYHTAAISSAYLGNPGTAKGTCGDIWVKFGSSVDPDGSDIRSRAELASNTCYYDVAKISRDPGTCSWITAHDDFNTKLFGDKITKDMCIDEVGRLAQLSPENYYRSNPNNICAIVFLLPLMVIGALMSKR
jgi:hypothetical protein